MNMDIIVSYKEDIQKVIEEVFEWKRTNPTINRVSLLGRYENALLKIRDILSD